MGLYTGVGRKKGGILGGPLLPAGWLELVRYYSQILTYQKSVGGGGGE